MMATNLITKSVKLLTTSIMIIPVLVGSKCIRPLIKFNSVQNVLEYSTPLLSYQAQSITVDRPESLTTRVTILA
jgi:hypothetical protein